MRKKRSRGECGEGGMEVRKKRSRGECGEGVHSPVADSIRAAAERRECRLVPWILRPATTSQK